MATLSVNIIVLPAGDQDASWLKPLADAYHSDAVKAFIDEKYHGTVLTSW